MFGNQTSSKGASASDSDSVPNHKLATSEGTAVRPIFNDQVNSDHLAGKATARNRKGDFCAVGTTQDDWDSTPLANGVVVLDSLAEARVVEVVDDDAQPKNPWALPSILICISLTLIAIAGVVVGGVCGSGHCHSRDDINNLTPSSPTQKEPVLVQVPTGSAMKINLSFYGTRLRNGQHDDGNGPQGDLSGPAGGLGDVWNQVNFTRGM